MWCSPIMTVCLRFWLVSITRLAHSLPFSPLSFVVLLIGLLLGWMCSQERLTRKAPTGNRTCDCSDPEGG